MRVGIPAEIKPGEHRAGLTPDGARELSSRGHEVLVERNAGRGAGFSDSDYQQAGAVIIDSAAALYAEAQLLVKVKEPQLEECRWLRPEHILFTFLHLAAESRLTRALQESGASCIAYETVTDSAGRLPLLAPMSEVAGRLSVQAGAHHLEVAQGGRGVLLGGVPGVAPAKVLILGGGVVGSQAARIALGMGADITLMDKSLNRLRELDNLFGGRVRCEYATGAGIEARALEADMVIGAVLSAGAAAPRLLSEEQVSRMQPGAVLVDVAIDQGGCFATSRPTTHEQPTYRVNDVVHYCVANIPSAVARTATMALSHATLPYILFLADKGLSALVDDPHLMAGLNIHAGRITHRAVAVSHETEWHDPRLLLSSSTVKDA